MPSDAATLMSTASLDRGDALAHLRHQPLVRPAHGGDDAELGGAGRGGLVGGLDQRRDVEPRRAHRRGEQAGLRAEVAVLRAAAGLHRDDALDLDLGAAPAQPHLVREREQVGQRVVGQPQHLEHLRLVEAAALLEHLRAGGRRRTSSTASGHGLSRRTAEVCRIEGAAERRAQPVPRGEQELRRRRARRRRRGSAPASGRAASISRSRTLLRQARSGSAGHAPSTTPASVEAAVRQRLQGQRGVVEGAERRVGDHEHRRRQVARQVGDRGAFVVVPHEQPAGALDEDQVAVGGELADPRRALSCRSSGGQPAAPRGGGGGERVGEAGVLVQVGDASQPAYVVEVARLVRRRRRSGPA